MGFKDILNQNAKNTINETVKSTVENHCSKQVQMYTVARHLAKTFERNAPTKFRECFKYNRCYYAKFDGEHTTVEQFVPGPLLGRQTTMEIVFQFQKMPSRFKAQTLVHYSYEVTDHKLMLLDIQGSKFTLYMYDPETATEEIMDKEHHKIYLVLLLQLFSQTMCAMNIVT